MHLMQLVNKLTFRTQLMTFIGFEQIHLMESARLCCWRNSKNNRKRWWMAPWTDFRHCSSAVTDNEEVLWIPDPLREREISLLPGCYWRQAISHPERSCLAGSGKVREYWHSYVSTWSRLVQVVHNLQVYIFKLDILLTLCCLSFMPFFYTKRCMKDTFFVCALSATLLFFLKHRHIQ